ncbi:MAG: alanine racemase [Clostridiales bacterium]|nr:alanine racemase [Clostridiales bacterium]
MNEYVIKKEDLKHNIELIKQKAGNEVIGVLKADGYGLGRDFLAEILKEEGINSFAVADVEDIEPLRENVLDESDSLLVMRSTSLESEAEIIADNNCIATVGSKESAQVLNNAAKKLGKVVKANIKIDTGLSRFGFLPEEVDTIEKVYREYENLDFIGIYTHFSSAFTNEELTKKQLSRFLYTVEQLQIRGIDVGKVYAASSPALLNVNGTELDAVRIGSAFTGRVITKSHLDLRKIGVLRSQVIEIKKIKKGATVGYSGDFTAKRDTVLAIVPVGHTDGLGFEKAQEINSLSQLIRRMLSPLKRYLKKERITVKINGKTARVVGAVGLTNCTVDITGMDVKVGDKVEIDLSPVAVSPKVKRIYE